MPKVLSYEDKKYQQKKQIYDSLVQVFSDYKDEVNGHHSWNMPVEKLDGITMRLIGECYLELTYHRYEVTTVEGLARMDLDGSKFLQSIVKELKKRFRKATGKHLKLTKLKDDRSIDKVSKVQGETSWLFNSSVYGYGRSVVGRYLVRDSCIYEFDSELLA